MVADVSPQTQQAWNLAANSGNVGADQYNSATAGYLGALGQTPASVTAGQISNTNLQPYMNPYTQSVINSTLPIMQQNLGLQQNQQQNAANAANAFGGSRQGVQQGVTQAQGAMGMGQMAAGLNQANFQQAQQAASTDIGRTLQAQQGNQQAQQAKINSDILASQGLTNTADSMNKANVANYGLLSSAGAGQSMQAQNEINAQMAKFNQAFNYPQQQLGTLLSALGMTPHDTSTAGQTTQQTTTPTDWANLISQGSNAAANIWSMSDKRMKTDITPLGKDPDSGVPMHAFRYKGDPKSYPKVVGPMAQDVQDIDPGAVKRVGSKDKGALAVRGYAAGTPFVQPSLAGFTPPSSPGVAKGIASMSAFRPPTRLPRGATMPVMPKRFAFGTANVGAPNMDDADLGAQMMDTGGDKGAIYRGLKNISKSFAPTPGATTPGAPAQPQQSGGWSGPSMGYAFQGYKFGTPNVGPNNGPYPGSVSGNDPTASDTVPAMLTPGEAVLTRGAAQAIGRPKIAAMNAMMPPSRGPQATAMPRAGARGIAGALANTKTRPRIAGGLAGA